MLRDNLLYALYEEITGNFATLAGAIDFCEGKLEYLTIDELECLEEMLECWFEEM